MADASKHYLKKALYLTVSIIIILLVLSAIPEEVTSKFGLKKIDILSDIRKEKIIIDTASTLVPDTIAAPELPIECPDDITCFEDFSENGKGLDYFINALRNTEKIGKVTRIAFYGDSYIEGDIFSGDFRMMLQDKFGGRGAGMIAAATETAGFRRSVRHNYGNWNTSSIISSSTKNYSKIGIAGFAYSPSGNAWSTYTGVNLPYLDTFSQVSIIYNLPTGKATISYTVNDDKNSTSEILSLSTTVERFVIRKDSINKIKLAFSGNGLFVHGISIEDTTGICLDNFSLRGSPGSSLINIPAENIRSTDSLLNYKLVVFQFGLNVMSANRMDYTAYQKNMVKMINHYKDNMRGCSFLLIGIGDRSSKKNGQYQTMPGVKAMIDCQRKICAETGIVFWNLFEAMGGENSMPKLVSAKPPKANKDYTHMNFEGGKFLAEKLYSSLIYEMEKHSKNKKR